MDQGYPARLWGSVLTHQPPALVTTVALQDLRSSSSVANPRPRLMPGPVLGPPMSAPPRPCHGTSL